MMPTLYYYAWALLRLGSYLFCSVFLVVLRVSLRICENEVDRIYSRGLWYALTSLLCTLFPISGFIALHRRSGTGYQCPAPMPSIILTSHFLKHGFIATHHRSAETFSARIIFQVFFFTVLNIGHFLSFYINLIIWIHYEKNFFFVSALPRIAHFVLYCFV